MFVKTLNRRIIVAKALVKINWEVPNGLQMSNHFYENSDIFVEILR